MVVYMSGHEGRGIGLWAKAATYILQDAGENTYQANRSLGLPDDSRDFSDAASLIRYFYGTGPFRLLTNNPKKVQDLAEHGLTDVTPVKHVIGDGIDRELQLGSALAALRTEDVAGEAARVHANDRVRPLCRVADDQHAIHGHR